MISRRKEENLEGLKKMEKMKTGSDPFIVCSIINIYQQTGTGKRLQGRMAEHHKKPMASSKVYVLSEMLDLFSYK